MVNVLDGHIVCCEILKEVDFNQISEAACQQLLHGVHGIYDFNRLPLQGSCASENNVSELVVFISDSLDTVRWRSSEFYPL